MDNTEIKKILVRRHREQNTSQQNTAAKKNNTDPTKNRTRLGSIQLLEKGALKKYLHGACLAFTYVSNHQVLIYYLQTGSKSCILLQLAKMTFKQQSIITFPKSD